MNFISSWMNSNELHGYPIDERYPCKEIPDSVIADMQVFVMIPIFDIDESESDEFLPVSSGFEPWPVVQSVTLTPHMVTVVVKCGDELLFCTKSRSTLVPYAPVEFVSSGNSCSGWIAFGSFNDVAPFSFVNDSSLQMSGRLDPRAVVFAPDARINSFSLDPLAHLFSGDVTIHGGNDIKTSIDPDTNSLVIELDGDASKYEDLEYRQSNHNLPDICSIDNVKSPDGSFVLAFTRTPVVDAFDADLLRDIAITSTSPQSNIVFTAKWTNEDSAAINVGGISFINKIIEAHIEIPKTSEHVNGLYRICGYRLVVVPDFSRIPDKLKLLPRDLEFAIEFKSSDISDFEIKTHIPEYSISTTPSVFLPIILEYAAPVVDVDVDYQDDDRHVITLDITHQILVNELYDAACKTMFADLSYVLDGDEDTKENRFLKRVYVFSLVDGVVVLSPSRFLLNTPVSVVSLTKKNGYSSSIESIDGHIGVELYSVRFSDGEQVVVYHDEWVKVSSASLLTFSDIASASLGDKFNVVSCAGELVAGTATEITAAKLSGCPIFSDGDEVYATIYVNGVNSGVLSVARIFTTAAFELFSYVELPPNLSGSFNFYYCEHCTLDNDVYVLAKGGLTKFLNGERVYLVQNGLCVGDTPNGTVSMQPDTITIELVGTPYYEFQVGDILYSNIYGPGSSAQPLYQRQAVVIGHNNAGGIHHTVIRFKQVGHGALAEVTDVDASGGITGVAVLAQGSEYSDHIHTVISDTSGGTGAVIVEDDDDPNILDDGPGIWNGFVRRLKVVTPGHGYNKDTTSIKIYDFDLTQISSIDFSFSCVGTLVQSYTIHGSNHIVIFEVTGLVFNVDERTNAEPDSADPGAETFVYEEPQGAGASSWYIHTDRNYGPFKNILLKYENGNTFIKITNCDSDVVSSLVVGSSTENFSKYWTTTNMLQLTFNDSRAVVTPDDSLVAPIDNAIVCKNSSCQITVEPAYHVSLDDPDESTYVPTPFSDLESVFVSSRNGSARGIIVKPSDLSGSDSVVVFASDLEIPAGELNRVFVSDEPVEFFEGTVETSHFDPSVKVLVSTYYPIPVNNNLIVFNSYYCEAGSLVDEQHQISRRIVFGSSTKFNRQVGNLPVLLYSAAVPGNVWQYTGNDDPGPRIYNNGLHGAIVIPDEGDKFRLFPVGIAPKIRYQETSTFSKTSE